MEATDVISDEKPAVSSLSGKEVRSTLILGLGAFFVFTAYMALQNLQGSLNDESGLGVISLSCLYAAAILSAIYAPACISIIGVKKSVVLAYTGHVIYVISNFYPSFYTLIPSSIIVGAITGPLWTSYGIYLTTSAFAYAERTGILLFVSLSRINGIFFTMFEFGNIVGNLLSSLVLYQGQYNTTYTNDSTFCGSADCPRAETMDIIADPEDYIVYILLGIFLVCVATGLVTITIFLSPIENQQSEKESIGKSLLSWFTLIIKTDIKFLIPLSFYLAIEQQFSWSEITKSFISCPIGIQNVGFVMTSYSVCNTLCTFIFSRIAKFTRRYILFGCAGALHMALMLWIYHWIPTIQDNIQIYALASLWGVSEGIFKTQSSSVFGEIFSEHKQAAFAVYEGCKSIAFTITFVYSSLICVYVKLLIGMVTLVVAMALYALVEFRFARKQQMMESSHDLSEEGVI